jgi:hypothetical protein
MAWLITTVLLTSLLVQGAQAPSSAEQAQIIEHARNIAREYTNNLPNFIATQTTRRQYLMKGSRIWKATDTLVFDVTFVGGNETYKLLTINGKPTKKAKGETGGLNSSGEFGSDLWKVFRPESEAKFKWEALGDVRGRPVHVFSYFIEKEHSGYYMRLDDDKGQEHKGNLAYSGVVYVDRENHQVMRFATKGEGIPAEWPITGSTEEADYGFVQIDGKTFLLPLHAETSVTIREGHRSRTVIDFSNFHRFSTGVTITAIN